MATQRECENCGELLFGAVNRCWKCGHEARVIVKPKIPPIRRSPVYLNPRTASGESATQSAGQILPWLLNMDLSEAARQRCSAISTGLGVIGCLVGIASPWAGFFGIVGLGFGLVGMPAKRRDLATMGLVLCVIALFLGLGQVVFDAWTRYASRRWIEELQGIR